MNASKALEMLIEDIEPIVMELDTIVKHGELFGLPPDHPQMIKYRKWGRLLLEDCTAYAPYTHDQDLKGLYDVEVLDIHKIGLIKIIRTALDAQQRGKLSEGLKEVKDFIEGLIEAGTIQYKTYKEAR